jgi:hypothetical protein
MKRWHQDYSRTHREWKKHYVSHVESNTYDNRVMGRDPYKVDCVCDQQKGRFRKKKHLDCGVTQCFLCHSDKYPKRKKTRQELFSEIKFKEEKLELD